jgi:16S rRNA (adenine1518-N6/adenine1519-N6)-dimethyltransferase
MQHTARKRFGQHFLTDAGIINAIVRTIDPQAGQTLIEIGPGLGALTLPLLEHIHSLTVVELDRDLARNLRNYPRLRVIEADVLTVDFSTLVPTPSSSPSLRLVGNLPYNISTPILFHLLPFASLVQDQHFMLQKEVIERMVAPPDSSNYSRLSVMLQWRYAMEDVLFVPPASFEPPPRVDSAVVKMVPQTEVPEVDPQRLGEIVQVAFSQRRKLLRHTLGAWLEAHQFAGDFDLQRRAQEVSVAEYLSLAQQLNES